MMAYSTTISSDASIMRKKFQRSMSAPGKFCYSNISSSSTANASSKSKSSSPTRSSSSNQISNASRERNQSGNHGNIKKALIDGEKKTCKNVSDKNRNNSNSELNQWHRLYIPRLAMRNSLVRIGTVEGDLLKRASASLIRPSSHKQSRRRCDFQRVPSRLSVMLKAGD